MFKRKIFNDPVHGFITVPHPIIFKLIEHPYYQRLRRIKQLSLTEYVYPGALHTRFHHALGAYHLMRKAINMMRIKGQEVSAEEELGACIAILLHDVGHGPYSHTLEHCILPGVSHEEISKILMEQLNAEFNGALDLGIEIFNGSYAKKWLHQLVSSQLDVDRLDYLTRDSFFTGVSEGVVNYDRIIEMMDVKDDEIVIEAKGIYSIEKFLIARRLMYWQVYLHKTVVCVEEMLIKAMVRARDLVLAGEHLVASKPLHYFLSRELSLDDFARSAEAIAAFTQLDDTDIMGAIKLWCDYPDAILQFLCRAIIDRRLFKIEMSDHAPSGQKIDRLSMELAERLDVDAAGCRRYLVFTNSTTNRAYNPDQAKINILYKDGSILDIAEASDQLNISVLSEPVRKHFLCYPKGLVER